MAAKKLAKKTKPASKPNKNVVPVGNAKATLTFKNGKPTYTYKRKAAPKVDKSVLGKIKTGQKALGLNPIAKPVESAAVKVLNESQRPVRAVARTTNELAKGTSVKKALSKGATEGLYHNKPETFEPTLKKIGVKNKTVRGALDLGLQIAGDPLTYATAGAGAVAKTSVKELAVEATREAIAKGATKKAADKAGRAAVTKSLKTAPTNKGLQIGVKAKLPLIDRSFERKTSGKTTAKLMRTGPTVKGRKLSGSSAATAIRNTRLAQGAGKDLLHDFRPAGRSTAAHAVIQDATKGKRAGASEQNRSAVRLAQAVKHVAPKQEQQSAIIDAIESKTIHTLPKQHQAVARELSQHWNDLYMQGRKRGLKGGKLVQVESHHAAGYVPHVNAKLLDKNAEKQGVGVTHVGGGQGRDVRFREPMSALRRSHPGLFSEDLPSIIVHKATTESERIHLHDLWQKVAKTGRVATRDSHLEPGELVYQVTPEGLKPLSKPETGRRALVPDSAAMKKFAGGKDAHLKHVILHQDDVRAVEHGIRGGRTGDQSSLGAGYDRAQGFLKKAYTQPNPSYHIHNLGGDTLNAWSGDVSAHSLGQSAGIIKTRHAIHHIERTGARFTDAGQAKLAKLNQRTIKIQGKTYTHADIIKEAEHQGVVGQGFAGAELKALTRQEGKFTRFGQAREDGPRLASYVSARKRGLSPADATKWVDKHHFDYGNITPFEHKMRRIVPFWTFFARNTRLQATKIAERPGKIATLGKVYDTAARSAGYPDYHEYAKSLQPYEQRGLPLPIKYKGKVYPVFVQPPTTDLNQLSANPAKQAQNFASRVTFFKTVGEILISKEGYSTFYQGPIAPKAGLGSPGPDTPAPSLVSELPGPIKKALGVRQGVDKKGKKIWVWNKKADYALRSAPEGNLAMQLASPSKSTQGQSKGTALAGWATGAKIGRDGNAPQRELKTIQDELQKISDTWDNPYNKWRKEDPEFKGITSHQYDAISAKKDKLLARQQILLEGLGYQPSKTLVRRKKSPDAELRDKLNGLAKKQNPSLADEKLKQQLNQLAAGYR